MGIHRKEEYVDNRYDSRILEVRIKKVYLQGWLENHSALMNTFRTDHWRVLHSGFKSWTLAGSRFLQCINGLSAKHCLIDFLPAHHNRVHTSSSAIFKDIVWWKERKKRRKKKKLFIARSVVGFFFFFSADFVGARKNDRGNGLAIVMARGILPESCYKAFKFH